MNRPFPLQIVIQWDEKKNGYVANVPALNIWITMDSIEGAARYARLISENLLDDNGFLLDGATVALS